MADILATTESAKDISLLKVDDGYSHKLNYFFNI